MDAADFIVLALPCAVFTFLVWVEIKSRRNKGTAETAGTPADTREDKIRSQANARA